MSEHVPQMRQVARRTHDATTGTIDARHGKSRHIAVRFDDAMFARINRVAIKQDCTFAEIVRRIAHGHFEA